MTTVNMEENTALTEVITIYERMKKGRAAAAVARNEPPAMQYRLSNFGLSSSIKVRNNRLVEEPIETVPIFESTTTTTTGTGTKVINTKIMEDPETSSVHSMEPQAHDELLLPAITVTEPSLGQNSLPPRHLSSSSMSFLSIDRERLNSTSSTDSQHGVGGGHSGGSMLTPASAAGAPSGGVGTGLGGNKPNNTRPINYILNFNKYKNFQPKKYTYFSSKTNLIQSDTLENLGSSSVGTHSQLLSSKFYWLDIIQPSIADLNLLSTSFNVHDLTIADIRSHSHLNSRHGYQNSNSTAHNFGSTGTEEKIELFKNYSYISMKLMSELNLKERALDLTFNILIFKDFVITTHECTWISIRDILGFINVLSDYTNTILTPDWILFSIFIELAQDAQYLCNKLEPEINHLRIESDDDCTIGEMSDVMKRIFNMEFQIYNILRFLKPKINILRILKSKCERRMTKIVNKRLVDIREDFQVITSDLTTLDNILQRSQRTFLALVDVQKSVEANEMSKIMKRISEVALVFLPIQSIAGFNGMNVRIPFQTTDSTLPFWVIVSSTIILSVLFYFLRKYLFIDNGEGVGKKSLLFWKNNKNNKTP